MIEGHHPHVHRRQQQEEEQVRANDGGTVAVGWPAQVRVYVVMALHCSRFPPHLHCGGVHCARQRVHVLLEVAVDPLKDEVQAALAVLHVAQPAGASTEAPMGGVVKPRPKHACKAANCGRSLGSRRNHCLVRLLRSGGIWRALWSRGGRARGRHALDNVGVVQLAQERDLAQRGRRDALILDLQTDLLQRDVITCGVGRRGGGDNIGRRGSGARYGTNSRGSPHSGRPPQPKRSIGSCTHFVGGWRTITRGSRLTGVPVLGFVDHAVRALSHGLLDLVVPREDAAGRSRAACDHGGCCAHCSVCGAGVRAPRRPLASTTGQSRAQPTGTQAQTTTSPPPTAARPPTVQQLSRHYRGPVRGSRRPRSRSGVACIQAASEGRHDASQRSASTTRD